MNISTAWCGQRSDVGNLWVAWRHPRERSKFMDRSNRCLITAAVAGVVLVGASAARAAEPSVEELKAQLQELNKKVAALETKQAVNNADVQATIDAVLRDAEQRSKLLADNADWQAGYDTTFFIRSGDAF